MKIVVLISSCLLTAFVLQAQNPSPNSICAAAGTDANSKVQVTWQLGTFPFLLDAPNVSSSEEGDDTVSHFQMRLQPNPTTDFIELNFGVELSPNAQIQIVDAQGRVQLQQTESTTFRTALDVSTLSNGTYYVKVNDEVHQLQTIQFTKTN